VAHFEKPGSKTGPSQEDSEDWALKMERKRAMLRGQRELTAYSSVEIQLDSIHGEMKMLRKDVQNLAAILRAALFAPSK